VATTAWGADQRAVGCDCFDVVVGVECGHPAVLEDPAAGLGELGGEAGQVEAWV